jgi:hypothetical protein
VRPAEGKGLRPRKLLIVVVALSFGAGLVGCRAEVEQQPDGRVAEDLASDDGSVNGGADGGDLSVNGSDLACPPGPVEICGNGCDDDRNGWTDDDDPACTPQVLATWVVSSPLQRLVLSPPYKRLTLDTHSVPTAAHGVYSGKFAPGVVFLNIDGVTLEILRVTLAPDGNGTVQTLSTTYATHDLCIFNNELIVVERAGVLHRLQSDGKTENGTVVLPAWTPANSMLLTACSTDGKYLYVSEHAGIAPSQFETLDATFAPVASPSPIPNALLNAGMDRCLDFAWAKGGFYGLFVNSGGSAADTLPPDELVPFALDGAVGNPIDAGVLHGIGEWTP